MVPSREAGCPPEVVSPQQLEGDPVGGLVAGTLRLIPLDLVMDASGGQVAVGQPGAELGAVVTAQHAVPGLEVGCYLVCLPQVVVQPLESLCLTTSETVHSLQGRPPRSSTSTLWADTVRI